MRWHLGPEHSFWLCCNLTVALSLTYTSLSLSQVGLEVAFYSRKHAEISSKQRRKGGGKSGLEGNKELGNHKGKSLRTCIWPNLTSSFLVIKRNRSLWTSHFISASQLHCWPNGNKTPTLQDCFEDERELGWETHR